MSVVDRLAALTPEQRALFEKLREKQRRAARVHQPPPIRPVSGPTGAGDWPLSLDQERFWFMEQLYPERAGLNIAAATRMSGRLPVPVVAAALDEIARRHAAWRTSFPADGGRPVQRVAPAGRQRLAVIDLSTLPEEGREAETLRLVRADAAAPFDLERGPLVRSSLIRLGREEHVCLLTIHHLVTDFLSFQIAWAELAALCGAFAAGRRPALPAPPVQYPDFAVWQREWLQGEVLEDLSSWWRERLAGFPPALELPTDRPRPAVARMRGDQRRVAVPPARTEALRALARAEGATLFMAVLASVAALLCRDSGQERMILGANNANRNRPEIEAVLGCFLTQVPFPIDLTGDPTFRELLARVRQSALGAYAHQDLPFGKLVEAVQPERDTGRQPLVQALVQVLDGHGAGASLAGVASRPVDAYDGNARYDLMLSLFDQPGGLAGTLEFDTDLFEGATAERLLDRLQALLGAVAADPGLRLADLPLLDAAEVQQLVRAERTQRTDPAGLCVHEAIAARARLDPDAEAVVCGGERLTYGELERRAEALAQRLRSLGVGPETPVALRVERSAGLIVGLLGILKSGGVYVPLEPDEAAARQAFVLDDSGAAAVVTQDFLDELDEPGEKASAIPAAAVLPENLAYCLYTSGSTGVPKGVAVTHAAAVEHALTYARVHGIGPGDRALQFNSVSFDPAIEQTLSALVAGATLVVRGPEMWDLKELTPRIAEMELTVVALPRAYWARWAAEEAGLAGGAPPRLRLVIAGGEEMRAEDVRQWRRTPMAAVPLLNVYGPTEAVVTATLHAVRPGDGEAGPVPIGRPLPGRVARVLGRQGSRQPFGVPGELCLGGLTARGYLGRPALTAERFVPDPFADAPGSRLYRTGDLARRRPDGALEFLGRVDDQVKVRGFRVEPGEVAAALRAHPGVREAAVVARAGRGGDLHLVAYFAAAGAGTAPPEEELRDFLRGRLPEYMLPAGFVLLDELPLNAHGKVDPKALPAPAAPEAPAGSAPPRNPVEELLAGIWSDVLGLERVGIHDNFFQLGGDSILSIQVVARARRAGLLVTTRQFFIHQTIAGLAAAAVAAVADEASGADQEAVEGEAPLTPIQRRFFEQERRQPWRFNQAVLLASREPLAAGPLAAALARLAGHHDALRLRFLQEEAGWRQLHAPVQDAGRSAPLFEIDLRALPRERRTNALEAAAEQLQGGLDLAAGPLFTAAAFRLGEDGDRLLLTAHHLVIDGVSWRVLLEDLAAPELPAKTTSWKRWTELLAAHAGSPELAGELPYWLGLPVSLPPLPADLAAEAGSPPAMATVAVELGAGETRALLKQAPEVYRTQVNDLLLAALARAFAAWTGEGTLLVELEGHGREEVFPGVDLSRTVGWFTTLFPVALALPPRGGPREAILAVKERLRAVPNRGLGYDLLRHLAGPETGGRLAALPAPEVSFNYLGQFGSAVGEDGLFAFAPEAVRGSEGEAVAGRPPFAVDALVLDDRLRVSWTYDPRRHLPATVERLAQGFLAELSALVDHCLSPAAGGFTPSDFPLAGLGQEALDRLLGNDRGVEDLYPLAPLQEGILFHNVYAAGADVYFEQLTAELEGPLDPAAFAGAWQRVVERHPVLRTAFLWRGVERPLQLVRRQVELPWTAEDWRGVPPADLDGRWRDLLAADRARGFDLERPPLMRLALVRTGEDRHRLVWSSHHLLFDGWCFALLLGEIFALHEGAPLPPPPRPYRDYIAWLAERDEAEAERYWRRKLQGFTAPTPVPFDHPEALGGRHAGGPGDYFERALALSAPRAAALEALAQRLRVTLNTLVQGAWSLVLSHHAQASDVVFGAVTSGRPAELAGVESMVGLFINSLPVRIEVPGDGTAAAWLARLQEDQFELRQHEWTPLTRIQSLAGLPAGESLFASLLVFENYPVAPAVSERLGGLRIREAAIGELTNYPLTLIAAAHGGLSLRLIADRRFEPATVRRLLAHLEILLEGLAADSERPPASLPLLAEAERHQLTVEWNDTRAAYPDTASIPALFAEQAALRPDAVAVEMGNERLTYGEVRRRAGRIARRLRAQGLRPGERVAVLAERTPDLIASLLGILEAGGAYLPIDPAYPPDRVAWMVRDAGAAMLPEGLHQAASEDDGPLPAVPAEALAYVMYTSGSTGTPKGVAVTHRNVIRLARGGGCADMGPGQAWLQLAPVAFDASTLEIWAPLLNGGRVVLFPGRIGSLDDLARVIAGHGVTSAWLTTGLFHEMVDGLPQALRPLRQLLTGGDVVSPEHARRVLEALPGLTLIDGYGPTECTTFVCCHRMTGPGQVGASVPIGRPIANDQVYVLDADLRPVPMGVAADLYAGGAGVSRGYLDRPDLTAERFIPDPFAGPGEGGARLYRTGDRVRWSAGGSLEFVARLDTQVKVRGFRVEPGEVEAALLACPGVSRAAVVAVGQVAGRSLAAIWVGGASMDELRGQLRGRLPEALVPSAWIPLADLPLTANGKVDRRALAALASEEGFPGRREERVAPRDPLEERLVAACAEVLGRDPETVGVFDNFFELGGHSLLATRLVSLLHSRWGIDVPMLHVFDTPHLAALAARVAAGELAAVAREPIPRRPPDLDPIPVSFAQERLWFLDRLAPGNIGYHIPLPLAAHGDLSLPALAAALGGMVRRHEALRTTYEARGDRPVQRIAPPGPFTLPLVDLAALPEGARSAEARRLADEEAARPFDLERDPVLRARALRLAPREHALLLVVHHIAADGWSLGVMVEEIVALYPAALEGRPSGLPELAVQYADFAVWQREWLRGEVLERQLSYWRERLAGAPALDLPTDRPRTPVPAFRGSTLTHRVEPETTRALARLARRGDATLFMVLLAAMQTLLGRYAGQDDVVLGSPIANRNRAEIEPLVGFFVNTLALRGDLGGDPAFTEMVARARRTALEAFAHQDLPFERLVEELRPERRLAHSPIFQVMFALQNAPLRAIELPGLTFSPVEFGFPATRFDLEVYFTELAGGLVVQLTYATDLFDAPTVARLQGHLDGLLAAALEDPSRRLSELSFLTGPERHQLLFGWNDTSVAIPREDVAALFSEQARRRPHVIAVSSEEGDLTYADLDRRSSRLARRLAASGVGPEIPVALLAQRSPAMIVGLLGILKAGGAYVPLDLSYPAERLAWMLADSGARILLGQPDLLAELETDVKLIELTADPEDVPGLEPRGVLPDGLAYVMYTSGSTGRPKGVGVTHGNIVRLVRESGFADLGPDQVFLQLAPVSFDASTLEIWAPLLNGGRVAVFPPRRPSLEELGEAIARFGVTSLWLTAGLFHQMVDGRLEALRPLRQLLAGGDVLSPPHVRRALEALPGLTLINGYGPTEGTTFTCCFPLRSPDAAGPTVPLGRPIGNTRVYVLDASLRPVPAGVWGELFIGGDGLSRGYLGRPDLTAERFVPDSFDGDGARLYRTGDTVRFRPDGLVEFLGRRDGQVKLRGFRVELGEIESALARHPAVREAVVVARDDGGPAGRRLVAYLAGSEDPGLVDAVRHFLGSELPEYMVPSAFVLLAALPLTPNGKVDRAALPAPEGVAEAREWLPPASPLEELLAGVAAEVLGLERVGMGDNFFDLGGHSLLATQLVSRFTQVHGVEVTLQMVFDSPTFRDLADHIVEAELAGAGDEELQALLAEAGLP